MGRHPAGATSAPHLAARWPAVQAAGVRLYRLRLAGGWGGVWCVPFLLRFEKSVRERRQDAGATTTTPPAGKMPAVHPPPAQQRERQPLSGV